MNDILFEIIFGILVIVFLIIMPIMFLTCDFSKERKARARRAARTRKTHSIERRYFMAGIDHRRLPEKTYRAWRKQKEREENEKI